MSEWLDRLKPGDLPIYRRTHAILSAFSPRREQITAREIATEILADPFATLHTLRVVNERVSQRYGTEVTTVEHALMMQGIGAYLDAMRKLPALEDTPAGRDARALKGLHMLTRRAQHAAWQARDFAVLHADVHAEEVQVAAILHHLPELLIWLRAPATGFKLERMRRRHPDEVAESLTLGASLKNWRLDLLEKWMIPALTRDLLGEAHAERHRQTMLAACIEIARLSDRGWWDERLLLCFQSLADIEHLLIEDVIATAHANAGRVARAVDWLSTAGAGVWIPMLPGPWPPDEYDAEDEVTATEKNVATVEVLPEAAVASARPDADAEPAMSRAPAGPASTSVPPPVPEAKVDPAPTMAKPAAPAPAPDKQVFKDALQGIETHLDGSYTLNQMSATILKGLHSGLGLSRILFAMVTPDGKRLKTRFTLGIASDDPLRQFEVEMAGKELFAQLMGKMQGVWLNADNRTKLAAMMSPALRETIGNGEFFAMSLHTGNRPTGMIYADRGRDAAGLDPLVYTDFKMLCIQAARGLGKVKPPGG